MDIYKIVLMVAHFFGLYHKDGASAKVVLILKGWFTSLILYLLYLDCLIILEVIKYNKAPTFHVSYTFETFEIFNVEFVFVFYQFLWTGAMVTSYLNYQRQRTETKHLIDESIKEQTAVLITENQDYIIKMKKTICAWSSVIIIVTALGANVFHLTLTASTFGGTLLQFPFSAYRTFLKCLAPTVTECFYTAMIFTTQETIISLVKRLKLGPTSLPELVAIRKKHGNVIQRLYNIKRRYQLEIVLIIIACIFDVLMNIYSITFNAYRLFKGPGMQYIDWFFFFNVYQAVQKGAQIMYICLPVDGLQEQMKSLKLTLKKMSLNNNMDEKLQHELHKLQQQCVKEEQWMCLLDMFHVDKGFLFMIAASLGSYITVLIQFAKGEEE